MERLVNKVIQFKNLILLMCAICIVLALLLSDPLGYCAARRQYRANIENQIAIAHAETQQRIAIIQAETEAALLRIKAGGVQDK